MTDQFRTIDSTAWRIAVKRARAERNEVSDRIKTLMRQGGIENRGVGCVHMGILTALPLQKRKTT